MRTVKELSDITDISVRTLHYYDQIGLLTPTAKSEAGYRLYDDRAMEQRTGRRNRGPMRRMHSTERGRASILQRRSVHFTRRKYQENRVFL